MTKRRKLCLILGLLIFFSAIADQILLHGFLSDGMLMGRRVAPFDPPIFYENQERAFARLENFLDTGEEDEDSFLFDAELGWCSPRSTSNDGMEFDEWGARSGPASIAKDRTQGVRRILALGCSFTLGDEVEDAQTWPFLLDESEEAVEILNFGVNAYGLDQAWLRYKRDGREVNADEVWLGLLPEASVRLGSMYRPVLGHWSGPVLFKPRFELREGQLELIANPAETLHDVHRLLSSQSEFLEALNGNDLWVQRAPAAYAPRGDSWLHKSGVGRAWLTYAESGARDPVAWLEDETSEIHDLLSNLVTAFREDVERDGARFRLLILPGRDALAFAKSEGRGYWAGLVDELRLSGTEVIDLTDACLAAGMVDDKKAWQSGLHYSPKSNGTIATALRDALKE
ncbi:MAG: hypothetical protein OSB10_05665 [Planctomycetota bacterium]|nr:hypothetical protein [Planctomycetota bacterium]